MSSCPYCQCDLKREPKRKMACPACGTQVYVRSGRPRTEDEAHALDLCGRLLIPESELQRAAEALPRQADHTVRFEQVVRTIVESRVTSAPSWHERKMLYFNLAIYLWESGLDCRNERVQAVRFEIEENKEMARQAGLRNPRLMVLGSGDPCPRCRRMADRVFLLSAADEGMPLPVHDCTHGATDRQPIGWCRCMYVLKID